MFRTEYGNFDGNSWEQLCQNAFKRKYEAEGYQQIPASPGDFGLEGYTSSTGKGFQCYCPDSHYERQELYRKQRDKITTDLKKLKTYEADLKRILGTTVLKWWVFVTPEYTQNELIAHARKKEDEVRSLSLSILSPEFRILIHDASNYEHEIQQITTSVFNKLSISIESEKKIPPIEEPEQYEANIERKSGIMLAHKSGHPNYQQSISRLCETTRKSFLESDIFFEKIEHMAPTVFARLSAIIQEFEKYVEEVSITWSGNPQDLTDKIRNNLYEAIDGELGQDLSSDTISKITRHMIARWTAICELDYG